MNHQKLFQTCEIMCACTFSCTLSYVFRLASDARHAEEVALLRSEKERLVKSNQNMLERATNNESATQALEAILKRIDNVLAQNFRENPFFLPTNVLAAESAAGAPETLTSGAEERSVEGHVNALGGGAKNLAERVSERLKAYDAKLRECEQQRRDLERDLNEVCIHFVLVFRLCVCA
jgi:hypothetical protein